jgi:hypothetical protein
LASSHKKSGLKTANAHKARGRRCSTILLARLSGLREIRESPGQGSSRINNMTDSLVLRTPQRCQLYHVPVNIGSVFERIEMFVQNLITRF